MDLKWVTSVSEEELNKAITIIRAELEEREDAAKARRLIEAIDKAISEFRAEYPTACWMFEVEDGDRCYREINLFDYEFDTDFIMI